LAISLHCFIPLIRIKISILHLYSLTFVEYEMTDVKIRELDWYLRDHLFKQSNKGRLEFEQKILPSEMIKTYLRYRDENIDEISQLVDIVVGDLLHHQVIKMSDSHSFELSSTLRRLQCAKCYYISYLAEEEEQACLRCNSRTLAEFPNKRIKRSEQ
jgi:ssDNA-binding Zn-finger/Zn-ribbon topoisomerase 1